MPWLRHPRSLAAVTGVAAAAAGAAVAQRRHNSRVAVDPTQARLEHPAAGRASSVTSADGTSLHVETFGPPGGEPVILIHGWTEELRYWTLVSEELARANYRVIAYDLRGHGRSGRAVADDYALGRFGEDVEAVLSASLAEGERAVLVGHSLGAMSIVAWAEHHEVGRRARAAALLNTGVGDLIAEQLLVPVPKLARALNEVVARRGFLGSRAALPRVSTPLSHALVRHVAFGPEASPAQVAFFERMLITCPPDVRADAGIAMSSMRLSHALPRLTLPTLVLAGADDRLTPPSHAKRIAAALPHLHRVVVLERTGHMAPLERPVELAQTLVDLAQSHPAEATAATV